MKRIVALVVASAFWAGAGLAWAQAAGTAPKKGPGPSLVDQIKKMETDRAQAVVKGDAAALESLTADDYTFINSLGHLSGKTETMNGIKSGAIKITSNELSDMNVRVYGNTAVVTGKGDTQGTINGAPIKSPVMFTRVYVKQNGRWQSVAFQQTPISGP